MEMKKLFTKKPLTFIFFINVLILLTVLLERNKSKHIIGVNNYSIKFCNLYNILFVYLISILYYQKNFS